jgi:hypothetical protein
MGVDGPFKVQFLKFYSQICLKHNTLVYHGTYALSSTQKSGPVTALQYLRDYKWPSNGSIIWFL